MKKPIIGVTPLFDRERDSYWMLPGYLEGLEQAGAIPIVLPLPEDLDDLPQLVSLCDGLLFTGGQDVSPALYGETPKPTCGEICPARDRMEQALLHLALERDLPSWASAGASSFSTPSWAAPSTRICPPSTPPRPSTT